MGGLGTPLLVKGSVHRMSKLFSVLDTQVFVFSSGFLLLEEDVVWIVLATQQRLPLGF